MITATELRRTSRKRNVSSLARLDVNRLRDAVESFGRDDSGCASRLDIVGRHWRLADELTIKEHLRIGDVRLYAQRAKPGARSTGAGAAAGAGVVLGGGGVRGRGCCGLRLGRGVFTERGAFDSCPLRSGGRLRSGESDP